MLYEMGIYLTWLKWWCQYTDAYLNHGVIKMNSIYLIMSTLTHWGRVTHICVNKLTITDSDNGLSPDRRQAIISTNAWILFIGPLGTNFSEILIEIHAFSFKKMHLKMSSGKWRPFCLGLNELSCIPASHGSFKLCDRFIGQWTKMYMSINFNHIVIGMLYGSYCVKKRYDCLI